MVGGVISMRNGKKQKFAQRCEGKKSLPSYYGAITWKRPHKFFVKSNNQAPGDHSTTTLSFKECSFEQWQVDFLFVTLSCIVGGTKTLAGLRAAFIRRNYFAVCNLECLLTTSKMHAIYWAKPYIANRHKAL